MLIVRGTPSAASGGRAGDQVSRRLDRSRRTVPITPALVAMFRLHRADQAAERLHAGDQWRDNGLVFATEFGLHRSTRATFCEPSRSPPTRPRGMGGIGVPHASALSRRQRGSRPGCTSRPSASTRSGTRRSIAVTGDTRPHESDDTARAAVDGWSGVLGL